MANEATQELFQVLDSTAIILQNELEISYLEAVYETGENLFQKEVLQKEELSSEKQTKLEEYYESIELENFSNEEIRKGLQLALLKGMKHGIQVNHQMTPDSIGFIVAYLLEKVIQKKKNISILDPACGTANLLTTVINQLELKEGMEIHASGVDVDDLLISLALVGADLQRQKMTLLHQDGLANLLVDPVDVVVSDLPVGFYPDDENAKSFELCREEGHSFAHFLFMEQGMRYTKPGGYLFFLVPDAMFGTSDFAKVDKFIKKNGHIEGIIKLPETLFKSEQARKSILILRKAAENVKPPKEVLLANLSSLTDPSITAPILAEIENWFKGNNNGRN